MPRHLPAVEGVFEPHPGLDKGVAGLAHHRAAAGLPHHVDGIPGQPGVVNDRRARLSRQQCGGDKPHQVIALDKSSLFIEEKAAVKVAVPGQAHRRPMLQHRLGGDLTVFRQQGVGHPVGKGRVRGVADLDELKRQVLAPGRRAPARRNRCRR